MVRYAILGLIELCDGQRRVPVEGRRQVAVLASLLMQANRTVSADQLIDAVWSDRLAGGERKRLQMTIARYARPRMADTGAPGRPTRWQKARADTKFLRWKNEAIAAAAAAPLSFGVLQLVGSEDGATDELIVVGVSVVAVLVLLPVAELVLNWLQAPMRLLTDDVIAIRRDLSGRYAREQETAQAQAQRQELALVRQSALQASEDIRLKIEMLARCLTDIQQVAVLVTHDQMPAANPWSTNLHSLLRHGEMLTAYRALLRFQRSYNSLLVLAKERQSQARAARMQQSLQQAVQSYDEEPLPSQLQEAYTDAQAVDCALRDALDALGRDVTPD